MKKTRSSVSGPRPIPPEPCTDALSGRYAPAPEVLNWVRSTILTEGGALYNEDHAHLEYTNLKFLWAPHGFSKAGRTVLGQCEEVTFRCGPWQKGRQQQQMIDWFGAVPDFLITLDASHCLTCSDAEFCALLEHELMHIGQEHDEFDAPMFTREGLPKLTIRAHDIEEFVGVVRRYGPSVDVLRLIEAAKGAPSVAPVAIAHACGTCLRS